MIHLPKNNNLKYNWVGYLAGLIAIGGLIAQIDTIYSRKSAKDLSFIHIGSRLIILSIWLIYGFLNGISPTIFSSITALILTIIILASKIHFDKEQDKKEEDKKEQDNTKSRNWGSQTWNMMHTYSYLYPTNPSEIEKSNAKDFYKSIENLIQCEECKQSFNDYITNKDINVNNRNDLINWVLNFHNTINKKLGKNVWNRSQLDNEYL